jgi:ankyrin repeat protein
MEDSQHAIDLLKAGDTDGLRQLLERNSTSSEARDASGVSLLMHCLYRGRLDLAELVASKKEPLDIFEACSLGRIDRVKELIGDASAVNTYSKDGFTGLHFACFFGQPETAKLLIESGAPVDAVATNPTKVMPLHSAAAARNLEAARCLLEHGAPVNARQQGGWVPIHSAAQNGDRPMVELLLKHGADPALTNDPGKTPSMVAREKGHEEIAALLERETQHL